METAMATVPHGVTAALNAQAEMAPLMEIVPTGPEVLDSMPIEVPLAPQPNALYMNVSQAYPATRNKQRGARSNLSPQRIRSTYSATMGRPTGLEGG